MARRKMRSTPSRGNAYIDLQIQEVTDYVQHLVNQRRSGRWRNIMGVFQSDAHNLGNILISMVKLKLLSLPRDLEYETRGFKARTLGKNQLDYGQPLVLGNTGKFVEQALMHTGLYYDSIGFTDTPLSLNRLRKFEDNGSGIQTLTGRKSLSVVGEKRISKKQSTITVGIRNSDKAIYPASGGKLWTMAQIAAFHEYGTINEPARPVWGPAIAEFNQMTSSGGFLGSLFSRTYNACEEMLLGNANERSRLNARTGEKVKNIHDFPTIGKNTSFVKSLYETNFAKSVFPEGSSKNWADVDFSGGRYRYTAEGE